MSAADVIDNLLGIAPGSALDTIRRGREVARDNMQASYLALFAPESLGNVTLRERCAVATFVIGLHRETEVMEFYAGQLDAPPGFADAIRTEIAAASGLGPYGSYPAGPLSVEDSSGPAYAVQPQSRTLLGPRLTAAFEHAQMLVLHPRDARAESLQKLLDAGWSTTDIVTLSQLVAFLSFQVRVVVGLRALQPTVAGGN